MSGRKSSLVLLVIVVVALLAAACGPERVPDAQIQKVGDSATIEGVTITLLATAEGQLCSFCIEEQNFLFDIDSENEGLYLWAGEKALREGWEVERSLDSITLLLKYDGKVVNVFLE